MVRAETRTRDRSRYYGRSRERRRRWGPPLAALILLLLALPFMLPLLLEAPDAARRLLYPLRYEEAIRAAAAEHGMEPAFVAGVVYSESRFDPEAESPQGAYGLMQILPETAAFISRRSGIQGDYRDPTTNVRMGTWYLNYLQNRYEGDETLVLAAYNSGEGQVDAWTREGRDLARRIPFEETREYVVNVAEARDAYADLYGSDLNRRQE